MSSLHMSTRSVSDAPRSFLSLLTQLVEYNELVAERKFIETFSNGVVVHSLYVHPAPEHKISEIIEQASLLYLFSSYSVVSFYVVFEVFPLTSRATTWRLRRTWRISSSRGSSTARSMRTRTSRATSFTTLSTSAPKSSISSPVRPRRSILCCFLCMALPRPLSADSQREDKNEIPGKLTDLCTEALESDSLNRARLNLLQNTLRRDAVTHARIESCIGNYPEIIKALYADFERMVGLLRLRPFAALFCLLLLSTVLD